jgi:hypothetical protein
MHGILTRDTPQRYKLRSMLNPKKTLEREAMLKRIRE